MKHSILSLAAALALSGCATRGAMNFECTGLADFVHPLPTSQLIKDIQQDAVQGAGPGGISVNMLPPVNPVEAATDDPMQRSMEALPHSIGFTENGTSGGAPAGGVRSVLLLSGGGQWGAFGAGFLDRLNERSGGSATDFGVVTGVSTGAVQALFVAVNDRDAYASLVRAYKPEKESEVVDRHRFKALAAITGAMAGLSPLRKRIEEALCDAGDPARGCRPIERLANSGSEVFVGMVEARTGAFVYADITKIAKAGSGPDTSLKDRRNALSCLTGITMASAAMPVFYQQVKINGSTYFDGGVRNSVFEAGVATALERAVANAKATTGPDAPVPLLFVLRNGPTQLLGPGGVPKPDADANRTLSALDAALRAESIVVNELEVGSIAALRLAHPQGKIFLATADGFQNWKFPAGPVGCTKPEDVMFDPSFMRCLIELGHLKADRKEPWILLKELKQQDIHFNP